MRRKEGLMAKAEGKMLPMGLTILLVFLLVAMVTPIAQGKMGFQGPRSPVMVANDARIGDVAWNEPHHAMASDDLSASCHSYHYPTGNYLRATSFGFTIPNGVIIREVVAEFEKRYAYHENENYVNTIYADTPSDNAVRIVKNGAIGDAEKGFIGADWPSNDTYVIHGSPSDLWGETWMPADINAPGFGVVISPHLESDHDIALIDHIRITVYYDVHQVSALTPLGILS